MAFSPRPFVLAALSVGPLVLLAGCGASASGARTTVQPVQPSSYVVQDPVTTTTTTTSPPNVTTPVGQISATEQIYTIVGGDSISKIAALHDISMDDLINYNGWTDGLNHFLAVGETVKIPPNALVPGTGTASTGGDTGSGVVDDGGGTPAATAAPTEGCTHTIASGENPTRVANKYNITVDQLREVNPGVIDTFLIGSTLVIPPGGDC